MTSEGHSIRGLVDRCILEDGSGAAWRELIATTDPILYLMARDALAKVPALLRDGLEPEDVANMVWLKLWQHDRRALREFRGNTEPEWRAYVARTTNNAVKDWGRRASAKSRPRLQGASAGDLGSVYQGAPQPGPGADHRVVSREASEQFERALRRAWHLKKSLDRDILVCQLHFRDDLAAREIALIPALGLGIKGVEKILTAGRKVLQKHFGGPGARSRSLDDGSGFEPPAGDHLDNDQLLRLLEVTPREVQPTFRHLSLCDDCRSRLVTLFRQTTQGLGPKEAQEYRLAVGDLDERVDRVLASLPAAPRTGRRWVRPVMWVGVAAAATLALMWGLRPPAGDPIPPLRPLASVATAFPVHCAAPLRLAQEFADEPLVLMRNPDLADDALLRDAERDIQRQLASTPTERRDDLIAYQNALGHLKLARSRFALAAGHFEAALRLDPNNAIALVGTAAAYFHQATQGEQDREMLQAADRMLSRVDPGSPHYERALYNRIRVALALNETERARSLLPEFRRLAGDDSGWAAVLTEALEAAGPE